jgi:hypothetical protein
MKYTQPAAANKTHRSIPIERTNDFENSRRATFPPDRSVRYSHAKQRIAFARISEERSGA